MFQLKDFPSIVASMINRAKATQTKITDFNIGSVARTLMESPAIEIEELYQRMFAGILDAIPVAIYRGFDFDMLEPAKARVSVTVTFGIPLEVPFSIPAGTVFLDPDTGHRYLLLYPLAGVQGQTSFTGIVEAESSGAAYNGAQNAISRVLGLSLPTGSTISHPAITSGADGEGEIERATRFAQFIKSIARGTLDSVLYGASTARIVNGAGETVERVTRVGLDERPGEVLVYIYGAGHVASAALLAEAQKILDGYWNGEKFVPGYRAVGVNTLVMPMAEEPYEVGVTVEMAFGQSFDGDVENDIIDRVAEVIRAVASGGTLYAENIHDAVLRVPGVVKVRTDLTENYHCPENIVLIPGVITAGVE